MRKMMSVVVIGAALASAFVSSMLACGSGDIEGGDDGSGSGSCGNIAISPGHIGLAVEGDTIVMSATTNNSGVATYSWSVTHDGVAVTTMMAAANNSARQFVADDAGDYEIMVSIATASAATCDLDKTYSVSDGGASGHVELVVRPAAKDGVAPLIHAINVISGASTPAGDIPLLRGRVIAGHVVDSGGAPMLAYVKFDETTTSPEIEAYTDANGDFTAIVADDMYSLVVVPQNAAVPSYRYKMGTSDTPMITVPAGASISGTIKGPTGAPLANAVVQLVDDGVASTTTTTAANGTYTVKFSPPSLGTAEFNAHMIVTPPAGSGLPKIEGGGGLNTSGVDATYASALAVRNAGGMAVNRAGAGLASTPVTIVGVIPVAATVTSAAQDYDAVGTVRIAATTNASGVLPTTSVPSASLSIVVRPSASDVAVADLDTTSVVPASVSAPMMTPFSLKVQRVDAAQTVLVANARIELVPSGALELAGIPTMIVTGNAQGIAAGTVAAGGVYEAHVSDPTLLAGARVLTSADAAALSTTLVLPRPVTVTGSLTIQGESNHLINTPIELRCRGCNGLDGVRPLVEGMTDAQGQFSLVVADPGQP
jgi:hypothetical protein